MKPEELEELQPTNDILKELQHDIHLEAQDAAGQGDRVGAKILMRLSNALERNMTRRAQREQPADISEQAPIADLESAAAEAANKKAN